MCGSHLLLAPFDCFLKNMKNWTDPNGALTREERKQVEGILEKAGWPDSDDDLYYDLTARLPG